MAYALVVIDMQTALVQAHPCREAQVVGNIATLLSACRSARVPVVYVQHDGGAGDELAHGAPGWEICAALAPQPGEPVIEKQHNSAFRGTELHAHLQALEVTDLILCGMQTEYCFDVSCKVAFELGYPVTIAKNTVTTFDSAFCSGDALTAYFEDCIWNNRYARVLPIQDVLKEIKKVSKKP